jgi:hypothetical protein
MVDYIHKVGAQGRCGRMILTVWIGSDKNGSLGLTFGASHMGDGARQYIPDTSDFGVWVVAHPPYK